MMNKTILISNRFPAGRNGATLAEILVALGVMSIGVTLVASLFPATITQAVRATQLTNSTLVKHQATEQVRVNTGLIPDFAALHASNAVGAVEILVIDPLGRTRPGAAAPNMFGTVDRFNDGYSLANARSIMLSNDSWVTDFAAIPDVASSSANAIVFENETAATNAVSLVSEMLGSSIPVRAFIETSDGKRAYARGITGTTGALTVDLDRALPTFPTSPVTVTTGNVRLQHFEERYSWMITSRTEKTGASTIAQTGTKLIVFFRRDFSTLSESNYTASHDPPSNDTNAPVFRITWTGDKPLIRRGGYLFDPDHGFWYQIQDIVETNDSSNYSRVLLDSTPTGTAATPINRFMIPPGIVQVYAYEFPSE